MTKPKAYYQPFDETQEYTQEDASGLTFHKVLPEGLVADVDMGMVTLQGPTHKWPGTHPWDQVYLVFSGRGIVHLDGEPVRIERPGIVLIPRNTEHSMEVEEGETMQYVYVNRHP